MDDKKIIIFGVGNQQRSMAKYLASHFHNIIGIVDNDREKWGRSVFEKYTVEPVENISMWLRDEKAVIVIATHRFHDEMKEQLRKLGWNREIIIAEQTREITDTYAFYAYQHGVDFQEYAPVILGLELSGYCNCECTYCPFHGEADIKKGHKGFMQWDTIKAIAQQVKNIPSIKTISATGPGEIFLNREWFQLLQYILKETGVKSLIIYTNGMLLTRENIELLLQLDIEKLLIEISIDGETEEENNKFRKGSIYKTIKSNIMLLKEMISCNTNDSRKYEIRITNCHPASEREVERYGYKMKERAFDPPQFLKDDFPDVCIVSKKTYSYGKETQLKGYKTIPIGWPDNYHKRCLNLFKRIAVDYAGNLLRCSCGHAAVESIGSVFLDDILRIWREEDELRKVRGHFINGTNQSDFCDGCPGKGMGYSSLFAKQSD